MSPTGKGLAMTPTFTVAVQYSDTTDILPIEYDNLQDAIDLRDKIVQEQEDKPWDGLYYVFVIVNGRVLI
jgi:hypothetical protein